MKKIIPLFAALSLLPFCLIGQSALKVTKLKPKDVPAEILPKGELKEVLRFVDREGDHLLVCSETGVTTSPSDESMRQAELYARHYLLQNGHYTEGWMVTDFVRDCPVDLEAQFVPNTTQVTDLNNDGVSEVWIMYTTACHGDVSPSTMKIIVYQGGQKFAMRGRKQVSLGEKDVVGGDYTFDQAFTEGPAVIREYAKKLWKKHLKQTWD